MSGSSTMDTGLLPVVSGGTDFLRSLYNMTGLFTVGLFGAVLCLRFVSSCLEGLTGMPGTGCTGRFTTSFFKLTKVKHQLLIKDSVA